MKNYWLSLLLLSTIAYAADEKEQEVSPLRYTMEYDSYRKLLIGTQILSMPTYDRYIWAIRSLENGSIKTKGLIQPKDDPQNATKYTPSDDIVNSLIKKVDLYEQKLAIEQSDEGQDGVLSTHTYYDGWTNSVRVDEIFKTPRYARYITVAKELSNQDMKVSGSITFLENLKTVFFEPSEQKCEIFRGAMSHLFERCLIGFNADKEIDMVIIKDHYQEGDRLIYQLTEHIPKTLSICQKRIQNLNTHSVHKEASVHYEKGLSDYVVYTPWDTAKKLFRGEELERPVRVDMNLINGSSENDVYYDRWLNAVVMTVKSATSEHIRFLKGIQKMDKHSNDLQTSGFLYLFKKMRTVPCDLSDQENDLLKVNITDFLKKCAMTYDDQGKLKKFICEHVGSQEGQIIAGRVKYRPGGCAICSKLIKDVDTNRCTISGQAHLFDDIFTVPYEPSEKEVSILMAKMKKYITEKNESQIKAIEQECGAYLDDYMKNVVQMSQIVECGDDGYAVVEDGDDSDVDLNSEGKQDNSIEVVLSLLEKYIALKNEAIVKF